MSLDERAAAKIASMRRDLPTLTGDRLVADLLDSAAYNDRLADGQARIAARRRRRGFGPRGETLTQSYERIARDLRETAAMYRLAAEMADTRTVSKS